MSVCGTVSRKGADTDTHPTTDISKNENLKEDEKVKKCRSKKLMVARQMPPLYHSIPGQNFDITRSQVIQWLTAQPEIMNYIWDNIKNSDDVFYDADTGKWCGADYKGG